MTRRAFIGIASGVVASAVPLYMWWKNTEFSNDILEVAARPQLLSQVATETEIIEIGRSVPHNPYSISDECDLTAEILNDVPRNIYVPVLDASALQTFLSKKVKREFAEGRIRIVKGWILSETEAMQCQSYAWLSSNTR